MKSDTRKLKSDNTPTYYLYVFPNSFYYEPRVRMYIWQIYPPFILQDFSFHANVFLWNNSSKTTKCSSCTVKNGDTIQCYHKYEQIAK